MVCRRFRDESEGRLYHLGEAGEQKGTRMTNVRKSIAELRASPRELTDVERARLDAMTDEEIEANALADPDNPALDR